MHRKLFSVAFILLICLFIIQIPAMAQVQSVVGTSVEQSRNVWNHQKDAAAGDNLTTGVSASGVYGYDGAGFDRIRGDATYGLDVDVTRMPAGGGNNFYAIKRDNIAAASVNLPFGFTSNTVIIETPGSNTDNIIVDWGGGTAAAPAANTAGDDIIEPGRTVIIDWFHGTSISVIAAGGTQTVYIRAFN